VTDSIEELATKLEAWAREDSKRAEPELGLSEHVTLRAAALKLRECREALEPFAKAAKEKPSGDYVMDSDFRRAAKALEAKW